MLFSVDCSFHPGLISFILFAAQFIHTRFNQRWYVEFADAVYCTQFDTLSDVIVFFVVVKYARCRFVRERYSPLFPPFFSPVQIKRCICIQLMLIQMILNVNLHSKWNTDEKKPKRFSCFDANFSRNHNRNVGNGRRESIERITSVSQRMIFISCCKMFADIIRFGI